MRLLALSAVVLAAVTPNFLLFWSWFEFWRRHRLLTYAMMLGNLALLGLTAWHWRATLLDPGFASPPWLRAAGWIVIALATTLAFVADRQIGLRVRSFAPFFEPAGRITLVTTGAYGLVRHPIYAAGIYYQLGALLVTGRFAVAAALVVLFAGALWFTRKEEERLRALLDDAAAYDRYRARVPALLPRLGAQRA